MVCGGRPKMIINFVSCSWAPKGAQKRQNDRFQCKIVQVGSVSMVMVLSWS